MADQRGNDTQAEAFAIGWYIVEQLGHKRLAGYVRETVIAGQGFLHIDVPGIGADVASSQWIHPSTVYAITPVTEATARLVAATNRPEPIHTWELPAARPARVAPMYPEDAVIDVDEEDDDDGGPEL